jgi:predicted RNA binding protein YcfA (HicA-like mRNA interferase family)
MPKLPRITEEEALRAFERAGFVEQRVTDSHHVLKKEGNRFILSIPVHKGKIIGSGLLRAAIRMSGLTVEQFTALLRA